MIHITGDDVLPRLSIAELIEGVGSQVAGLLATERELRLVPLASVVPRSDAPAVMLVTDSTNRPRGVLACSSPSAPDMVRRAMSGALEARQMLREEEGHHILLPVCEGRVRGLSYAVLPHCAELSRRRGIWRIQRSVLSPALLDWLWNVTAATATPVAASEVAGRFVEPLEVLASLASLDSDARTNSRRAVGCLRDGTWRPSTVLMHGDLWKGNVLLRHVQLPRLDLSWRRRFVIIDWPGSIPRGYAFFDLVRLALSLRLSSVSLSVEVDRHCRALACERDDAMSYLLAALGHIAMRLEHFPLDDFVRMAHSCCTALAQAINTTPKGPLHAA